MSATNFIPISFKPADTVHTRPYPGYSGEIPFYLDGPGKGNGMKRLEISPRGRSLGQ